jgi:hypothetical protein
MPARYDAGENTCHCVSGLFRFDGGLKAACSQDWLRHERPKAEWQALHPEGLS